MDVPRWPRPRRGRHVRKGRHRERGTRRRRLREEARVDLVEGLEVGDVRQEARRLDDVGQAEARGVEDAPEVLQDALGLGLDAVEPARRWPDRGRSARRRRRTRWRRWPGCTRPSRPGRCGDDLSLGHGNLHARSGPVSSTLAKPRAGELRQGGPTQRLAPHLPRLRSKDREEEGRAAPVISTGRSSCSSRSCGPQRWRDRRRRPATGRSRPEAVRAHPLASAGRPSRTAPPHCQLSTTVPDSSAAPGAMASKAAKTGRRPEPESAVTRAARRARTPAGTARGARRCRRPPLPRTPEAKKGTSAPSPRRDSVPELRIEVNSPGLGRHASAAAASRCPRRGRRPWGSLLKRGRQGAAASPGATRSSAAARSTRLPSTGQSGSPSIVRLSTASGNASPPGRDR